MCDYENMCVYVFVCVKLQICCLLYLFCFCQGHFLHFLFLIIFISAYYIALFCSLSVSCFLYFYLQFSYFLFYYYHFFLSDVIELYCYACCLYHSHEYLHYHNIAILFVTIIIVNTVIITFIVTFIIAVISFLGVSICLVFFLSFFPNFVSLHHSLSLHILRIFFYSIFCLTFSVHL